MIREVVQATGDIITVAGNGTQVYSGNTGPATEAELAHPYGVAVDAAGDLFIADAGNNVIREVVKATGDIITVAGNGTAGYSGDNGPATAAELNYPTGVAVDAAGDLFIADTNNNVIREVVKATGDIITVAGNGTRGLQRRQRTRHRRRAELPHRRRRRRRGRPVHRRLGQQRDPRGRQGDRRHHHRRRQRHRRLQRRQRTRDRRRAERPHGVAVDAAGDLFIADTYNNVIREVVKATGDIITVAGNGTRLQRRQRTRDRRRAGRPLRRRRRRRGRPVHRRRGQQRDPRGRQGDRRHHHRRRQRYLRLQRRQRTRDRRRAGRPDRRRRRRRGRPVHRRLCQQRRSPDDAGGDRDHQQRRHHDRDRADRLDRGGRPGPVGHLHRDSQRLDRGRGNADRRDRHLQRPERNARQPRPCPTAWRRSPPRACR